MDIAEPPAEPGRDLDVHLTERQPKRRGDLEDFEMTAILAQPVSGRTCEVCGLLVHADLADNNYIEEALTDENVTEKTENQNAGGAQRGELRGLATQVAR